MKKVGIGYLFWDQEKTNKDLKIFKKVAKKLNIELIPLNIMNNVEEDIEEKAKKCNIIFNNSAEEFTIEVIKTLENLGKKVIDSSKAYYYLEDKWMFFLKCKKYKIPTLNTILLSENINLAKKELKSFGTWPIILKKVEGSCGDFVEKADNLIEAINIIKKFQSSGKLPIIAQEFVHSPSYRVTIIDKKIIQTAIKQSNNWKCTGVYAKKIKKFEIDKNLRKIINRVTKNMKIKICGIDLLKKDGKWLVLEINASPGLDFFKNKEEEIVKEILNFLKKKANHGEL